MAQIVNGKAQPGANDFHVDPAGLIQPGLGADEPSARQILASKSAAEARLAELKAKMDEENDALTERERALQAKEAEIQRRLDALEKAEYELRLDAKRAGASPDAAAADDDPQ